MINVNELMLGNLIKNNGKIARVCSIEQTYLNIMYLNGEHSEVHTDQCFPVEIEIDLLIHMGFDWLRKNSGSMELRWGLDKHEDPFYITAYTNNNLLVIETDKAGFGDVSFSDCVHVHDLQRYVYACCNGLMLSMDGEV